MGQSCCGGQLESPRGLADNHRTAVTLEAKKQANCNRRRRGKMGRPDARVFVASQVFRVRSRGKTGVEV